MAEDISFEERVKELDLVHAYFEKTHTEHPANSLSDESFTLLTLTIESLRELNSLCGTLFKSSLKCISYLGTNVVENFFSQIRAKVGPDFIISTSLSHVIDVVFHWLRCFVCLGVLSVCIGLRHRLLGSGQGDDEAASSGASLPSDAKGSKQALWSVRRNQGKGNHRAEGDTTALYRVLEAALARTQQAWTGLVPKVWRWRVGGV